MRLAALVVSVLLSFTIVSPNSARTVAQGMDWVEALQAQPYSKINLFRVGLASSEWTTDTSQMGRYSVRLHVKNGTYSKAGILVPVDMAIDKIVELKFSELIKSYTIGRDLRVVLGVDSDEDGAFDMDLSSGKFGKDAIVSSDGLFGSKPPKGEWIEVDHVRSRSVLWYVQNATDTNSMSFRGNWSEFISWLDTSTGETRVRKGHRVRAIVLMIGGSSDYQEETVYVDFVVMNGLVLLDEPLRIVNIDIRPGTYPNDISLKDEGLLPAAILGSSSLNVTTIEIATIRLGGTALATQEPASSQKLLYSYGDINSDGYMDLVLFFRIQDLVRAETLNPATTQLTLTANLKDREPIQGTDSVRIIT